MSVAATRLEILQVRKLIQCVREADTPQISKIVELGVPNIVNYQEPDTGWTALHVAVTLNSETIVSQLLELGASNSVQDIEGCTPVMKACQHGHLQSLEALSAKGLALQVADVARKKALFHCLHPTGRHVKCLSYLLEYGADPNTKTTTGIPLVFAVCEGGFDKLLEKLLDKGADPNAREPSTGKPAVVVAVEGGHVVCLKLLAMAGADLNASFSEPELSAIHRGATLGQFECLQALSAYGANFSVTSKSCDTALHCATLAYRMLCIRFLGQRGCPANEVNEEGFTPQKIAKNEGTKDAMKELKKLSGYQDKVAKGGKPKGFSESWCIRLFDWLQINKQIVLEVLKTHEDNKNGVLPVDAFTSALEGLGVPLTEAEWPKLMKIYDKKGEGSINWDDFMSDHKYVHAQFKLGPNDDLKAKKGKKGKKGGKKGKGKKGKTKNIFPIYFEAERPPVSGVPEGQIEKEEFLTDYQRFSRDSPLPHSLIDDSQWYLVPPERQYINLYEAIRHGDMDSLEAAFQSDLSPDCRDKYNKTPLMVACAHGRSDMARYLLDKGADINAIDNFMWTPLHHACHAGEEELVKLLLGAGACIDSQSFNGGTPLMRAIETSQRSIIKLLLEKGAKLTPENKHGDTALEVARNWGDEYIYALVYAEASRLPPPPSDGKKGKDKATTAKGKGDKKGKKRKKKGGGDDGDSSHILPGPPLLPLPPLSRLPNPLEHLDDGRRRYSLHNLQSDIDIKPVSSRQPRQAWVSRPPTTQEFHEEQKRAREERGIESTDFEESKMPFQLQIIARTQALEITDL